MKRIVSLALVIALVATVAPFASAQGGPAVTGAAGENRALGLQVYGNLDLQMRYGDSGYATGVSGTDDPAWVGSPKMLLGLKANLADKASAVVELYVPRIGGAFGAANYFGGAGTDGGIDIGVRQAYVKIEDALVQDLAVTFGAQDLVFDVVGGGNPLLISLGDAELAGNEGLGGGATWQGAAGYEARPGGLRVDYKLGAVGSITAFHMIVGLNNLEDMEAATGIQAQYKVTEKTSVEGLISLINCGGGVNGKGSEVWLIGIGAASNGEFVDGLNLFAQVGFNAGTYTTNAAGDGVDASGLMFDIGATYQMDMAMKPKFGVEYLYVSGDEADAPNEDYEGFISYEDNDDLIVLEDNEFGFDVDQNYSVIKIRASITADVAGPVKDNFTLELLLGISKLVEEIGPVGNEEDGLGTEIDIKASWAASKNVTVYGGFGFLVGSDVLEKVVSGFEEYDSAFTYFIGTNVTF